MINEKEEKDRKVTKSQEKIIVEEHLCIKLHGQSVEVLETFCHLDNTTG